MGRVAELARDLRKAVSRAVERRREIEERHVESEEEHQERIERLQKDFDQTECEIASMENRLLQEQDEDEREDLEGPQKHGHHQGAIQSYPGARIALARGTHAGKNGSGLTPSASETLLRDLRAERAEHDAARKCTVELREELRGTESLFSQLRSTQASRRQH